MVHHARRGTTPLYHPHILDVQTLNSEHASLRLYLHIIFEPGPNFLLSSSQLFQLSRTPVVTSLGLHTSYHEALTNPSFALFAIIRISSLVNVSLIACRYEAISRSRTLLDVKPRCSLVTLCPTSVRCLSVSPLLQLTFRGDTPL